MDAVTLPAVGRAAVFAIVAVSWLSLPASSLAGTYTWSLASDFTTTPPGANPDHDPYGATPWSYKESQSGVLPSHNPGTFGALGAFGTGIRGGLAGWHDPGGQPLVAVNPGATFSNGTATFPAGQVVVQPSLTRFAVVGWTASISGTFQISGTVRQDDPGTLGLCTYSTSWTLDHSGGALASGSGAGAFSKSLALQRGDSVYFTLANGLLGNPSCDASGLALTITAPTTAPQVTLGSPANGALITGGQPAFSGTASTLFGASSRVTVRVYAGSSAGGAPLQTLSATRSPSGTYVVGPSSPLPDGVYTAQAEQDDTSSPPAAGFSAANTFRVANAAPTITLDSLGDRPLLSSSPTITGGGAAAGGSMSVTVYPGGDTNSTPVRTLTPRAGSGGRFSAQVSPGLADGRYTVVATQGAAISRPMTFRIKAHPPAVTLDQPPPGSSTSQAALVFTGSAGTALGDSPQVTMTLYPGSSAHAHALGSMRVRAGGGTWSARWPRRLKFGQYTAVATQTDDAGHTASTAAHAFRVIAAPAVIGRSVGISRRGIASVAIGCPASGHACTGDVLVLTARHLSAVRGGPSGSLRVMFAYLTIPAGRTVTVRRRVQGQVLRALRHAHTPKLRVTATLAGAGSGAQVFSAVRRARLG
jgi:hypothetical protein